MKPVTAEDLRSLRYFHAEKGDVTRYAGWTELEPRLVDWEPGIAAQLERVKESTRRLALEDRELFSLIRDRVYELEIEEGT